MKKLLMVATGFTALACAWAVYAANAPNCNGMFMNDGEDAVQPTDPSTPCGPGDDDLPCIDIHYEDYCYKCVGCPGGPYATSHCEIGFHTPINWTSYWGWCEGGSCTDCDPNEPIETHTDDNCDGGTNTDQVCFPPE